MADPAPQTSITNWLSSMLPDNSSMAGAAMRAVNPSAALMALLRQYYGGTTPAARPAAATPERPAPIETGAPPTQQGPRQMTRQAVPTVTPGAAASTPPSETGSSEPSLLETLRRSIQEDATPRNDASTRLASFGRGVLSGRGSFLDNLSAGLASQETADATRREEMRKASEAQMRLVEADRKAMLDKAKFGAEAPWRESQANLANAQADYYRRRASEPGAAGRPLSQRDLANYRLRAEVEARNQVAARYRNAIIPPPPEQIQTEINAAIPQILERILATEGMTPSAAPAAPQQPAIPTLNPAGRPTQ